MDQPNEDDRSSSSVNHLQIDESKKHEDKIRIQRLLDNMSDEELVRYETFRRVGFNKNNMKKYFGTILNQSVNNNFVISVCGVAKVFLGELIETAIEVRNDMGHAGPLRVMHVHEAYRRLYEVIPHCKMQNKNKYW